MSVPPVVKVPYYGGPWDGTSCSMEPNALRPGDTDHPSQAREGAYVLRVYAKAPAGVRWEWTMGATCQ